MGESDTDKPLVHLLREEEDNMQTETDDGLPAMLHRELTKIIFCSLYTMGIYM